MRGLPSRNLDAAPGQLEELSMSQDNQVKNLPKFGEVVLRADGDPEQKTFEDDGYRYIDGGIDLLHPGQRMPNKRVKI